jgi:hypothetical protein
MTWHVGAEPERSQENRMGDDVIIGSDGKPRCAWSGADDTAGRRYHDEVWGTRTYTDSALFEALTLGVFQAGLSWSIVFNKRNAFRAAFPQLPGRAGCSDDQPGCQTATARRLHHP